MWETLEQAEGGVPGVLGEDPGVWRVLWEGEAGGQMSWASTVGVKGV